MKYFSPFLLLFSLFLTISCNDKKKLSNRELKAIQEGVQQNIKSALLDTLPFDKKMLHIDKAAHLVQISNNDSLLFQVVATKFYLLESKFPDSTGFYLKQIQGMASRTHKPSNLGYVASKYGEYYFNKKQYTLSFSSYNQSTGFYKKAKDSLRIGVNLLKMAQIQQVFSDYNGSESSATEALTYLIPIDNQDYLKDVYNLLASVYAHQHDFEAAIKYYQRALAHTNEDFIKMIIRYNIAEAYLQHREYEKAITLFEFIQQLPSSNEDPSIANSIKNSLGYARFKKDGSSGIVQMEEALNYNLKHQEDAGLLTNYAFLSEYYVNKVPQKALEFARKRYRIATKINQIDDRIDALEHLINWTHGNISKQYALLHIRLSDSNYVVQQQAKNQFAKIKYDSSLANKENRKLKIENELAKVKEQQHQLIYSFSAVLIAFTGLILYFIFRFKHKKEKLQASYDTETRIAKKLHDELANDVFTTMTYAETQDLSQTENRESLLQNLDTIYARTRNISKENSTIDTQLNYLPQLKVMISGYNNNQVNVLINGIDSCPWQKIEKHKKIIIYRIIQELLVNMRKHSQCSLCVLSFSRSENRMRINYSDNGVGLDADALIFRNGLLNVENRINTIKGVLTFDTKSQKGFKVQLEFPI